MAAPKVSTADRARTEGVYQRLEKQEALQGAPPATFSERFGELAKTNPWAWGIYASIQLTGYCKLLNKEVGAVTAKQLVFSIELLALNFFNGDIPLTKDEIETARKAARDYYINGRKQGDKA